MDNIYEFEGFEWKVAHAQDNEKEDITVEDYYSWGAFVTPAKYVRCSLEDQALRKCVFDSQQFIECDFSMADASDSQFINCLFLDCKFNNSNFGKTSFIGCAFIESAGRTTEKSNFDSAGLSQVRFFASATQKTIIAGITFHGLGFRHSVFHDVIIRKSTFDYCSFENALLDQCDIDVLKLDRSSCRGIVIKECHIQSYISTLEKTIGAIGALEMLEHCKEIELEFANLTITDTRVLINLFIENANKMRFADNGKLFEFINIMQYLYKQSKAFGKTYLEEHDKQLVLNSAEIDGFRTSEFSEYLSSVALNAYDRIIGKGERIDIDDILYALKMMYFLEIHEYKFMRLLEAMLEQMNLSFEQDYAESVTLAQINYYLDKVGQEIKKEAYQITLLNESTDWKNPEERLEFQQFIDELFASSGDPDYTLISLHEGSAEAILEFIHPQNLLTIILILGVRFGYSDQKGMEFRIDPSAGIKNYAEYLKAIVSIFPFLRKKKVEEDVFKQMQESISKTVMDYISKNKLSGKVEQKTARRNIQNKKRKEIKLPNKDGGIGPGKQEKK